MSMVDKADFTLGTYGLTKFRTSNNIPLSKKLATRFSASITERDGFTKNLVTGQDLDDASNISLRSDWLLEIDDISSLRVFGQYFKVDRNGSAMKGVDDVSSDPRELYQDSLSKHDLTSLVVGAIYETDLRICKSKSNGKFTRR